MSENKATLTCPYCNETHELEMPTSYCQISYQCEACGNEITPKEGDCCIFCSYADKNCPGKEKKDLIYNKIQFKVFNV